MVINRVRDLGSGPHTPTKFFWEYPPPGHALYIGLVKTDVYGVVQARVLRRHLYCSVKISDQGPFFESPRNLQARKAICLVHLYLTTEK